MIGLDLPDSPNYVDQNIHSDYVCGPATILNALKFGGSEYRKAYQQVSGATDREKLHRVIDRYFRKPSAVFPNVKRLQNRAGTANEDFVAAWKDVCQEFDLPTVEAFEVQREELEPSVDFIKRMHSRFHASLRRGVPPLVSLRSQVAKRRDEDGQWYWRPMAHHFVVVTAIEETIRDGQHGFEFEYIDPAGGKLGTGFFSAERRQPYAGLTGNSLDGKVVGGNRFMIVSAPSAYTLIDAKLAAWHERTMILLNYYVGL